jgi:hypothetical protein
MSHASDGYVCFLFKVSLKTSPVTERDMSKEYPAETEPAADDDSDDVNYDPVPYDQVSGRPIMTSRHCIGDLNFLRQLWKACFISRSRKIRYNRVWQYLFICGWMKNIR